MPPSRDVDDAAQVRRERAGRRVVDDGLRVEVDAESVLQVAEQRQHLDRSEAETGEVGPGSTSAVATPSAVATWRSTRSSKASWRGAVMIGSLRARGARGPGPRAGVERGQVAPTVQVARPAALDLAARGPRHLAGTHEDDVVHRGARDRREVGRHLADDGVQLLLGARRSVRTGARRGAELLDRAQRAGPTVRLEHGARPPLGPGVQTAQLSLEVVRVEVASRDDEELLMRPVTTNCPSCIAPRSPVRSHGPVPSAATAPKVSAVAAADASPQYPAATLPPRSQTSPTAPSGRVAPSASTTRRSTPLGTPQHTRRTPGSTAAAVASGSADRYDASAVTTRRPSASAASSAVTTSGSRLSGYVAVSVASARPYPGPCADPRKPTASNRRVNASRTAGSTGSAPPSAQRRRDRSSSASWSSRTRRAHWS